ncbi:MAG: SDR family oxidoreductase [Chloroflexota bacterium]|nr:SDR family oxidoreductase [Chloroflexota bacterium]
MKVLFIGGTGIISSACTPLAEERGVDLYLLNRGQTDRPVPEGVTVLHGDIRSPDTVESVLDDHTFDSVVNWIAFTPEHVQTDIELFRGRTGQYVFISSASVYQTPPASLPVTESTMLDNPFWEYSRQKIACEELLVRAYRDEKFPMTIVRPSHTYDARMIPIFGGYTALHRMMRGQPVIVPGDGTSLWTLTHHTDFAKGFVPLLGNHRTIGEAYHITSDEWLSWNQITRILADAAGVEPSLVHVPSELINAFDPDLGAGLLGDKQHSMIFDNSKIKRLVPDFACIIPFSQGAREMVAWRLADPARQMMDDGMDALMERIITAFRMAWP